jgi:Flp pilus assembly protein TadD
VAYAYEWDRAAAERSFARALTLEPEDPVVLLRVALFRSSEGRASDVLPLIRRAVEVDPLSAWVRFVAGKTLHLLRRYGEAADVLREALELNPHHAYALSTLGCVLMARGELDEALDALERASALAGRGPWMLAPLCQLRVARGERERAERYAEELLRRRPGEYVSGSLCAFALAALGRADEAMHELARAVDERDFWLPMAGVDPLADPLRRDPRFAETLRSAGVPRI